MSATAQTRSPGGEAESRSPAARSAWLLPGFSVLAGLALVAQALAGVQSRNGNGSVGVAYWVSFAAIAVPAIGIQLNRGLTRRDRLGIALVCGLSLYMIKVLSYPVAFTYFDEFSHLRTATDILASGRVFHHNPTLVVGPFYPGLELLTVELSRLAGISLTASGFVVIGIGRIVLVAALFALFTDVTESPRVAGLATVIYMANPSFLYFDSDFSYESLALPLGVVVLATAVRWMRADRERGRRPLLVPVALVVPALVVTHHVTTYAVLGVLALLCVAAWLGRLWGSREAAPWPMLVCCGVLAGIWVAFVAPSTTTYLAQVFGPALHGTGHVLNGSSGAAVPFSGGASAAVRTPQWLRFVAFGSVGAIVVSLPLSVVLAWRQRGNVRLLAFAVVAVIYVPVQLLRLSSAGVETANRAPEFLFLGIAPLLATCAGHLLDRDAQPVSVMLGRLRVLGRRPLARYLGLRPLWIVALGVSAVLFVGGVEIVWPAYGVLPGPYLPGADIRSVSAQAVDAARWLKARYGPGQRVMTDRTTAQIMLAFAQATPVEGFFGTTSVFRVMVSPRFDNVDRHLLRASRTDFIVVDTRQSTSLPERGYYFSPGELEDAGWRSPISLRVLTKFAHVPGIALVYDNGPIQIYDVRGALGG